MEGQREVAERALGYPLAVPERSFAIVGGGVVEVADARIQTEGNYDVSVLEGISCRLETGEVLAAATAYLSRHGCLQIDGEAAALTAVRSRHRSLAELTPRQGALPHSP